MRAAVFTGETPSLTIEEIPRPTPRRGEVLLEVAACGVCHTDLHVMKREVAFPTPCVLGHEVSGIVAEIGPDVSTVAVGDRVVCAFIMPCGTCRHCVRGHEDLCETFFGYNRLRGTLYDGETRLARADGDPLWMYSMGGLAEYCVVPATDVFAVPDGLDLHDAAVLGCSAFTAFGAVHNVAELRLGETVAIVATGGIGSALVQFAHAAGAGTIIAVDRAADKLEAAKALGATHTVDASTCDPVAAVRELTGGRGVDVSFEALGHPSTFATAVDVLDDGGRAVIVGIAPAGRTGEVDLARIVRRKLRILGSYGARARSDMPQLLDLAARGVIRPSELITRRYGLAEADAAYQALSRGEVVGRAVVDMRR
ncbi:MULTISPECIES: zinc-binding dehydrogenase [unclassified Modestobacter]|uniref:zinc-binding dehydrogenase n=1 Tax=unclassified Modestobacter TaxID=2643866 RepID=UPI0022AAC430|nr:MULTISPECIES: zinc-binding dehydrogenase [unclassified Modestobacter]MCZ2824613.1 zinc-binding dehydrogenase [Modestobacter sp. VKM Ac-2981]MCZ2853859.1 zinc-binding dehydrogenase [Modestobacter sp. VKM Ac-2982]